MNELSNAERETNFNIMADDRCKVHVFSDDPLRTDQLVVRKGKKQVSEAQRAQMSERMRSLRRAQSTA